MRALYDRHAGARHLDVGVGTGYFLDHCRFPTPDPQITLLDLNENSLAAAAKRIRRYSPQAVRGNVLEPVELGESRFDSVGLNFLLHCLPGSLESKAAVFRHLRPYVEPRGVFFGSTILGLGVPHTALSRRVQAAVQPEGHLHERVRRPGDAPARARARVRPPRARAARQRRALLGRRLDVEAASRLGCQALLGPALLERLLRRLLAGLLRLLLTLHGASIIRRGVGELQARGDTAHETVERRRSRIAPPALSRLLLRGRLRREPVGACAASPRPAAVRDLPGRLLRETGLGPQLLRDLAISSGA